jgi:hypothetical protein
MTLPPAGEAPRCADCEAMPDTLIGLGDSWLCMGCFQAAVAALGERIRQLRKARLN